MNGFGCHSDCHHCWTGKRSGNHNKTPSNWGVAGGWSFATLDRLKLRAFCWFSRLSGALCVTIHDKTRYGREFCRVGEGITMKRVAGETNVQFRCLFLLFLYKFLDKYLCPWRDNSRHRRRRRWILIAEGDLQDLQFLKIFCFLSNNLHIKVGHGVSITLLLLLLCVSQLIDMISRADGRRRVETKWKEKKKKQNHSWLTIN